MDAARTAAAREDDGAPPAETDDGADERTVTYVEEADELLALARAIGASGGAADPPAYARVASIVRAPPLRFAPRFAPPCAAAAAMLQRSSAFAGAQRRSWVAAAWSPRLR